MNPYPAMACGKFISPGAAHKSEFFAADGAVMFGRVDVWPLPWKDDQTRRSATSG